jgi:hypothetical protein
MPQQDQPRADPVRSRTQTQVTAREFRRHVHQTWQIATALCATILAFVAVSVAVDIHIMRTQALTEIATMRTMIKTHNDSMEWRADTLIGTAKELEKTLDRGIFQVRVQVQQSSQDQLKAQRATNAVAHAAVQQAQATTQLVERVVDGPKPVVTVEMPKTPPQVVVQQPAPAAVPKVEIRPRDETAIEEDAEQRRTWWKMLLPWNWGRHDAGSSGR